ncbi:uncharacterized protein LOC132867607, partial [Neoarius graeffei]|uniref:uncharacterized protein LOC132867607 n=1 Tax=Neoarius graeffei TaxID=443677 RepID=UPI00298C9854
MDSVLPCYHDLKEVFSKSKASGLPPYRTDACAIDLLLGTTPPHNCIYPLSITKQAAMEEYVQEDNSPTQILAVDAWFKRSKQEWEEVHQRLEQVNSKYKQYTDKLQGETPEYTPVGGILGIHKEGAPLRPIISSINSVTYNIAKHLATILAPLVGNTPYHVKNSQDFASKVADLKLDSDETMVSYDVTSLFTCIPTTEAVESVRKRLLQDSSLLDRTKLTTDQICTLLDLCLTTTYFQFNESFYRQKHGCAMGSPVSPIVANLYMEEVEHIALTTFAGVAPSHWFRYVDDTWVKIKIQEVEAFSKHINAVDSNINFTREDVSGNNLAFLDCDVHIRQDRSLSIEVYRKPTHTDQYLLFDSHHPLEHKLGVIRTLQHRAQNIPTTLEGKEKEQNHIKKALQNCGYPNWAFLKSIKRNITDKDDNRNKRKNIVIPYISGLSEKLRRIFYKHNIPVHFRPDNTLKQKLVHPKDRIPRHKQDNVVYAIQCSENCTNSYIGETKQPLYRRLAQHRRASSSGQDSAVYIHLNNEGHSFRDCDVRILAREDRWYERGVKEAIFVNLERPSLNRGGGLRHH